MSFLGPGDGTRRPVDLSECSLTFAANFNYVCLY